MKVQVVDLFCGIGGLTCGLIKSGLSVIAGLDNDSTCQYAYEHNNHVPYKTRNIREVACEEINEIYEKDAIKVLVGCAPCQPFSQMRFKMGDANFSDTKYDLLLEFGRLIQEIRPAIISMENVPQIKETSIYKEFTSVLSRNGYNYDAKVIFCPNYGIPQTRRRFVLVGSIIGQIEIINETHDSKNVSVREFIADLPPIEAGETDPFDPLHHSARLTAINLKRIRASIPGGTWHDWPEELRCECHRKKSGSTYASVYGRMEWDKVGPTITTQFYNYGTGRFGHPEQDRALSLREGALLQTFPKEYNFISPDKKLIISDIARHIGNAVPVRLAEIIGLSIIEHLKKYRITV